jgi:hypothetical protein
MILSLCCLLLLVGQVASADDGAVSDPNDTFGPLDIERISHGHTDEAFVIRHRIKTRSRWGNGQLGNADSEILMLLTTDDEPRAEWMIQIDYVRSHLRAILLPYVESDASATIGDHYPIEVWRPTRRSVEVAFSTHILGDDVDRYGWTSFTRFEKTSSSSCRSYVDCSDEAPDGEPGNWDRLSHDL